MFFRKKTVKGFTFYDFRRASFSVRLDALFFYPFKLEANEDLYKSCYMS